MSSANSSYEHDFDAPASNAQIHAHQLSNGNPGTSSSEGGKSKGEQQRSAAAQRSSTASSQQHSDKRRRRRRRGRRAASVVLDPELSVVWMAPTDLKHVQCRFYRLGACTAGDACPFSHEQRESGQGKPLCKWFQKGWGGIQPLRIANSTDDDLCSSCKFGHKCANAHILPGQAPSMDWWAQSRRRTCIWLIQRSQEKQESSETASSG